MYQFIAKTFHGLEFVLEQELNKLGATEVQKMNRAVSFKGDLSLLYLANMSLRTALRVIHPLAVDKITDQHQLYDFAKSVNWVDWFTPDKTIAVRAIVSQAPAFNNSAFVALKVKDAIADQFRDHYNKRPFVDKMNPDIQIDVHIHKDTCTLSIDSTGDSLHRRGYRSTGHKAPLNEMLAAGLVLMSNWDIEKQVFFDPFCGSGTIMIEAGMIAKNIAPNVHREDFAFKHWKNYENKKNDKAWLVCRSNERKYEGTLYGSDIHRGSIQLTRDHVTRAKIDDLVRIKCTSFEDRTIPQGPGIIITNPPYGERLRERDTHELYQRIGNKLKFDCSGYEVWMISSFPQFNRSLGLKPNNRKRVFNGALECEYMHFSMYQGKRKGH